MQISRITLCAALVAGAVSFGCNSSNTQERQERWADQPGETQGAPVVGKKFEPTAPAQNNGTGGSGDQGCDSATQTCANP